MPIKKPRRPGGQVPAFLVLKALTWEHAVPIPWNMVNWRN